MSINTITIADLKTTVSTPEPLYYITNRNKEGVFWLDNSDTSTTGNDATVIVTNAGKRYKRIYDGPANIMWFGASPSETPTNNSTAFQNAIDQCNSIFIPEGNYTIKYPIVIPATPENEFKTITGAGIGATKIIKDGNDILGLSTKTAPNRGGTITDIMDKDACFILEHDNNAWTYNITIQSFSLSCNNSSDFAIYAPRNTHFNISSIIATEFKTGYFTYDTWTAKFEMTEFIQSNSSSGTNYSCFHFADDTSGFGTGTTCTFINCLAVGYNVGFNFYGLTYSSIIDSSSVNIKGMAYKFSYCHQLNIIGCGAEAVELDRHLASVFFIESSELNIQAFYSYSITSTVTGGDVAGSMVIDTSNVNIQNAQFVNFTSVPANTYNIVIQNSSYLWSSNLVLPTNGNNFISYTGDSSWLKNSINGTEMLGRGTLASSTSPIFQFPQVDSQPVSAATGTTIFNTSVGKLQTWDGSSWNNLW
jgi:hypothetical protein